MKNLKGATKSINDFEMRCLWGRLRARGFRLFRGQGRGGQVMAARHLGNRIEIILSPDELKNERRRKCILGETI